MQKAETSLRYAQLDLRTVPTNTEVFCAVCDYAGKADLSKGYWNPTRKLAVT